MKALIKANVLILGKTGVGKTALFNYLFGQDILKTGAGRPVTGMGLFAEEVILESGLTLSLYDSWGMEADKTKAWENLIKQALADHQGRQIEDWFHGIIFCISAKSARVEAFELEIIESLINAGNPVIIALTHCDVSEKEGSIKAMRQVLTDKGLVKNENIIEVNSVEKTLLGGRQTKTFGKAEILLRIQDNLLKLIVSRMPEILRAIGQEKIEHWFNDCQAIIKKNVSFFNPVSQKKEKQRNVFFNQYARSIFNEIEGEANHLFYEAYDYFIAFTEHFIGGALVAVSKKNEMMPLIEFRLHQNARIATEIIGNFFIFIPVLGAFGKQFIRKKSQQYYLQGLKENKDLLENQLSLVAETLKKELQKIAGILNKSKDNEKNS